MLKEKLIRNVTEIGNGAHIFAPREWLNSQVIIIRVSKVNPKEQIIKLITPYLDKIIGVFLYGSYARGDEEKTSDIDVFIISSEKFKIKSENVEFIIIPENKLELAKKINPVLYYSMLSEAKPIINSKYLANLIKENPKLNEFNEFIRETKTLIKLNKTEIEISKDEKYAPNSAIYSLVLRLRGLFLINLLLKKQKYSRRKFKKFIEENSSLEFEKVYNIYSSVKEERKIKEKLTIEEAKALLKIVEKLIDKLK